MLATIAKKYGVTVKAIEAANPGIDANRLKVDASIKIPAATAATGTPRSTAPGATGTGVATGTPRPGTATPGSAGTPARTSATTIHPGSTYTIKRSDTLATISKAAYGSTGERAKIFQANRDKLDDPDNLPVGVSIKIP
jgi:nucleoid-associated protein YgaU